MGRGEVHNPAIASVGATIENPVTGERITWVETAAISRGELLSFDLAIAPGGSAAAPHRHARQEECFRVERGSVEVEIAGARRTVRPGERVVVPVGAAHRWWNAGAQEAVVRVELRPALDTETFFETFFGLARDGATDARGMPDLLAVAALHAHHGAGMPFLTRPPVICQRAGLWALAPIARLCRRRAAYERHSPAAPAVD